MINFGTLLDDIDDEQTYLFQENGNAEYILNEQRNLKKMGYKKIRDPEVWSRDVTADEYGFKKDKYLKMLNELLKEEFSNEYSKNTIEFGTYQSGVEVNGSKSRIPLFIDRTHPAFEQHGVMALHYKGEAALGIILPESDIRANWIKLLPVLKHEEGHLKDSTSGQSSDMRYVRKAAKYFVKQNRHNNIHGNAIRELVADINAAEETSCRATINMLNRIKVEMENDGKSSIQKILNNYVSFLKTRKSDIQQYIDSHPNATKQDIDKCNLDALSSYISNFRKDEKDSMKNIHELFVESSEMIMSYYDENIKTLQKEVSDLQKLMDVVDESSNEYKHIRQLIDQKKQNCESDKEYLTRINNELRDWKNDYDTLMHGDLSDAHIDIIAANVMNLIETRYLPNKVRTSDDGPTRIKFLQEYYDTIQKMKEQDSDVPLYDYLILYEKNQRKNGNLGFFKKVGSVIKQAWYSFIRFLKDIYRKIRDFVRGKKTVTEQMMIEMEVWCMIDFGNLLDDEILYQESVKKSNKKKDDDIKEKYDTKYDTQDEPDSSIETEDPDVDDEDYSDEEEQLDQEDEDKENEEEEDDGKKKKKHKNPFKKSSKKSSDANTEDDEDEDDDLVVDESYYYQEANTKTTAEADAKIKEYFLFTESLGKRAHAIGLEYNNDHDESKYKNGLKKLHDELKSRREEFIKVASERYHKSPSGGKFEKVENHVKDGFAILERIFNDGSIRNNKDTMDTIKKLIRNCNREACFYIPKTTQASLGLQAAAELAIYMASYEEDVDDNDNLIQESGEDQMFAKVGELMIKLRKQKELQDLAEKNGVQVNGIRYTDDTIMNIATSVIALMMARDEGDPRYRRLVDQGVQKRTLKVELINAYKDRANDLINRYDHGPIVGAAPYNRDISITTSDLPSPDEVEEEYYVDPETGEMKEIIKEEDDYEFDDDEYAYMEEASNKETNNQSNPFAKLEEAIGEELPEDLKKILPYKGMTKPNMKKLMDPWNNLRIKQGNVTLLVTEELHDVDQIIGYIGNDSNTVGYLELAGDGYGNSVVVKINDWSVYVYIHDAKPEKMFTKVASSIKKFCKDYNIPMGVDEEESNEDDDEDHMVEEGWFYEEDESDALKPQSSFKHKENDDGILELEVKPNDKVGKLDFGMKRQKARKKLEYFGEPTKTTKDTDDWGFVKLTYDDEELVAVTISSKCEIELDRSIVFPGDMNNIKKKALDIEEVESNHWISKTFSVEVYTRSDGTIKTITFAKKYYFKDNDNTSNKSDE